MGCKCWIENFRFDPVILFKITSLMIFIQIVMIVAAVETATAEEVTITMIIGLVVKMTAIGEIGINMSQIRSRG